MDFFKVFQNQNSPNISTEISDIISNHKEGDDEAKLLIKILTKIEEYNKKTNILNLNDTETTKSETKTEIEQDIPPSPIKSDVSSDIKQNNKIESQPQPINENMHNQKIYSINTNNKNTNQNIIFRFYNILKENKKIILINLIITFFTISIFYFIIFLQSKKQKKK